MRATVRTGPGKLEVLDIPKPEQDGKSIITKVLRVGICGSDLSIWKAPRGYENLVLGHEYCLEVEDPGPTDYKKGDRIIHNPTGGCLFCDMCNDGLFAHCLNRKPDGTSYADAPGVYTQGAYAEYLKIRPDKTYLVPDATSSDVATLVEPLSFAFHCVNRAVERDGALGKRVLVTGGGLISMMVCEVLRSKGVEYIAVTEVNRLRIEHAKAYGAVDAVFDPACEEDMAKLAAEAGRGFDLSFECTGKGPALELLFKFTKRLGTVLLAGISFAPLSISTLMPVQKELTIVTAYGSPGATFDEALELAGKINDRLEKHITYPNITLEGAQKALEHQASGESGAIKLVIDPHLREE